jgi:DNA-binding IclR family transcriptional regulator
VHRRGASATQYPCHRRATPVAVAGRMPRELRIVRLTVTVVELLAEEGPLSLATIVERTNVGADDMYRILGTLRALDWVWVKPGRTYMFELTEHLRSLHVDASSNTKPYGDRRPGGAR